ncbi:MAG: Wzz/FepE/Etk N-terminal domain-containing protein [Candidatus Izemoplasmatales bacterium]|jgi:capsular polysaccharide biosynthesis protein|nr:Wzz/FepE/Etk N-terminal domain-containing protein [bacterium]MDZ4195949.1 Wzz/FepE/Etk N-terminal domain-containing protein [Candidatus Izemoplasmatales bacterium]
MDELRNQDVIVEEGITLSELIAIVWKNITLVVLVTLWVTVLGVIYTFVVVKPTYTAEASIMILTDLSAGITTEQSAIQVALALIPTYQDFMSTRKVLDSVVADIDGLPQGYSISALRNSFSISRSTNSLIVYIKVVNQNPELAKEIANQLVENSILIADNEQTEYRPLKDKLRLVDLAITPTSPTAPNKMLNVVISFLLGGILSFGIIFLKELFNNKFQSTNEMEKYLGINVIAAVPGTMKERKLVD